MALIKRVRCGGRFFLFLATNKARVRVNTVNAVSTGQHGGIRVEKTVGLAVIALLYGEATVISLAN